MTFAIVCLLISLIFIRALPKGDINNPNGLSVTVLQKALVKMHNWFRKHPRISLIIFAYPQIGSNDTLYEKQSKIERLVWFRLVVVAFIAVMVDVSTLIGIAAWLWDWVSISIRAVIIIYLGILQFTLFISLMRPLFGAVPGKNEELLEQKSSNSVAPFIPSPRRSLLMALINFAEIIISWGVIYRCLVPHVIHTMDQANYFSVVTFTTLGYGEINAGLSLILQLSVTLNMIVFMIFTICHVTTIMGAMSNSDPQK